jgi:uncharacterized lipoprotein YddW (UPF0748 family)
MKRLAAALLAAYMFTSCEAADSSFSEPETASDMTYCQQEREQLGELADGYVPVNYQHMAGEWFPYMHYENYMHGKSEDEFRESVRELYSAAKAEGINTLFLHVHPCGDAYYRSEIFPRGTSWDGDYDPFAVMIEEAHKLGLSVHAWLNPLRCLTTERMKALPDSFVVKQWTENGIAKEVNGRWYLDPSCTETDELLRDCIREIITNYDVDGIHIDDYFYPTTAPEFDAEEFAASGSTDLGEWRRSNCTRMVRAMYDEVKSCDSRVEFGISPQGSISGNYDSQFADVRLWSGEKGYCDYIVPQLYFGFENESCPFAETLALWETMTCPDVRLVAGLGAYKLGKADKWAGAAGENEWIESPDIIQRQIELVEKSSVSGYALYR